ncbi:MAG: hypothetical protein Q4C68_04895 [Moraxella sp.]|nr:hypothetical protein [Moraxella sp.]
MEFYNVYSAVNNEAAYADLRQSDIGIDDLIWIFTEKFKNLVLENDLKIDFIPI